MGTRVIKASISYGQTDDLKDGRYARFAVTSDTGAVANATPTAARLYISSFRSYAANYYLSINYTSSGSSALAETATMAKNDSVHAETVTLNNFQERLITGTASNVYLVVEAISGDGNKINFRDPCTITLEIDYTLPPSKCGAPGGVKMSSAASAGDAVTLSWSKGTAGTNNTLSHYQVGRRESVNGSTAWGDIEIVTTTEALSCQVLPPAIFGHHFRYYVRTVGHAGEAYASDWAACADTLEKTRPTLAPYTDETITAGETPIKAAHMLELQANVNRLRQGLGLASYAFTTLRAGYTSLAGWSAHVAELRAAIDEMPVAHEAWISISVNCPTAAVMMQLRRVVAAI